MRKETSRLYDAQYFCMFLSMTCSLTHTDAPDTGTLSSVSLVSAIKLPQCIAYQCPDRECVADAPEAAPGRACHPSPSQTCDVIDPADRSLSEKVVSTLKAHSESFGVLKDLIVRHDVLWPVSYTSWCRMRLLTSFRVCVVTPAILNGEVVDTRCQ